MKYIEKVKMIPIHRLSDEELTPCLMYVSNSELSSSYLCHSISDVKDWACIKVAVDMPMKVYDDKIEATPDVVVHNVFKAGADMKPALISTHGHGDERILIVTIRGTVTTEELDAQCQWRTRDIRGI
jgi:hypothetical protein